MEFFRIISVTTFFQPIPASSSSSANGTDSVFIPITENYVMYRLLHVGLENFREHLML